MPRRITKRTSSLENTASKKKTKLNDLESKINTRRSQKANINTVDMITFEKYKDAEENYIGPEGLESLMNLLDYSMEGIEPIILSYIFNCETMGIITAKEWESVITKKISVKELCDKVDAKKADIFNKSVNSNDEHLKFYKWVFNFAKESGKRVMDTQVVIGLVPVILDNNVHVDRFIEYLKEKENIKVLNRDQWNCLYELSTTIATDYSNYDLDGAWPVLYDEFVGWAKQKGYF